MNFRAYAAEALGTFTLTFVVFVSLTAGLPLATPIIAALTVGVFVYTVGHISGTHLNPAVTFALASVKKISPSDAVMYVLAQFLGAALATMAAGNMMGSMPAIVAENTLMVAIAEAIGAFLLLFGIAAVVYKKVPDAASGLTIGTSLLMGIVAASSAANGVLNPAVAFGIGSVSVMYMLAPIVGAVAGVWAYKTLVD